jgi:tRNA A-37 threonylcarbamoyl transferase component Bud32
MASGTEAALKVAAADSEDAEVLMNEAAALLALQPLWGRWVPELLAAGTCHDGEACVLATRRIHSCRQLEPSRDMHLQPQVEEALAAVQALGLAHGDVRRQNVLVEELQGAGQRVWLIDWGFAAVDATPEEQQRDWAALRGLYGQYGG